MQSKLTCRQNVLRTNLDEDISDWLMRNFAVLFALLFLKPDFHIIVMVPAVVSKAEYDYGTCVLSQVPQAEFNLVCGTVQSGKSNLRSLQ